MWFLRRPRFAAVLALIGLLLLFAAQNSDPVAVSFFTWDWDMPVVVLILASLCAGVLLGWLLGEWRQHRAGSSKAGGRAEGEG